MSTLDVLTLRRAALMIGEAVERLDRAALKALGQSELRVQNEARLALLSYFERIWDGLKEQRIYPAVRPEYQPLAALIDILTSLHDTAPTTGSPNHPGAGDVR